MELTAPAEGARLTVGESLEFAWTTLPNPALYRLEIETLDRKRVFSALVLPGATRYQAPPWIAELANGAALRWRVVALNQAGVVVARSGARRLEP